MDSSNHLPPAGDFGPDSVPGTGPSPLNPSLQTGGWGSLGVTLVILGLALIYCAAGGDSALASTPGSTFDPQPLRELKRDRPEYVFIGNSMLGSRIDPARLEQLSGSKIGMLEKGGSGPARWFLALKNYVVASGTRPKTAFIFFRDNDLTEPLRGVTRGDGKHYEDAARAQEPEFEAVIQRSKPDELTDKAYDLLKSLLTLHRFRVPVEAAIERWSVNVAKQADSRPAETRPGGAAFQNELNGIFLLENLRAVPDADLPDREFSRYTFSARVEDSFLPAMALLAEQNGLHLTFVRVQRRPSADGPRPREPRQRAALGKYIEQLRNWLDERGFGFVEMNNRPEIGIELYGNGDHIAPKHRAAYTELFFSAAADSFGD